MSGHTTGEKLHSFLNRVFTKLGMADENAAWTAETVVMAELRGVTSHGVIRMPHYARRLEINLANPTPDFRVVKDAGALALVDGDNGMGQVVSKRAMEEAIARARTHNVGVVLLKESNHFGAAATYAAMAPEAGMVGLVTTNTLRVLPPAGGKEARIGNNPVSIALPSDPPMVLDMALSVVARGYIIEAARAGATPSPRAGGWTRRENPPPTPIKFSKAPSSPRLRATRGVAFPSRSTPYWAPSQAEATATRSWASTSSAAKAASRAFSWPSTSRRCFPLSEFRAAANTFISIIKATPKAAGVETIFIPGEIEHQKEAERRRNGFELSPERLTELDEIAERLDLPPLERE